VIKVRLVFQVYIVDLRRKEQLFSSKLPRLSGRRQLILLIRNTGSNAALQSHQDKTLTPGEQGAIVKPPVQQTQLHGW